MLFISTFLITTSLFVITATFLTGLTSPIKGMNFAPRRLRGRTSKSPSILLFVHPRCPHSIATVRQLRNILLRENYEINIRLSVLCPPDCRDDWYETSLLEEARRIQGIQVVLDYGGTLTKRYGALTSGMLLFYNDRNQLVFQGGITPTLGHEGDCPGRHSLEQALAGETPKQAQSQVFGCQLFERS